MDFIIKKEPLFQQLELLFDWPSTNNHPLRAAASAKIEKFAYWPVCW
jgi:hypothetical protein